MTGPIRTRDVTMTESTGFTIALSRLCKGLSSDKVSLAAHYKWGEREVMLFSLDAGKVPAKEPTYARMGPVPARGWWAVWAPWR